MEASKEIEKALRQVMAEAGLGKIDFSLERPNKVKQGDYAVNIALTEFAILRKKFSAKTPFDLAEKIARRLKKIIAPSLIEKIEVIPPGFINFYLSPSYLKNLIKIVLAEKENFGRSREGEEKTVVIDYSAPNIAKPFGVGHLRSTIIGQALYNLYEFLGYKVIGDNHIGDWGTQFGKLIYQIEEKAQELGLTTKKAKEKMVSSLTIKQLEKLYIDFHQKAAGQPLMEEQARNWFKKLEDGNEEARMIWQILVASSMKEYEKIYNMLSIKIDFVLGESFYQKEWEKVLLEAKKKNLLQKSRGAEIILIEGFETPAMLVKSDGATTYLLRDLATIKYRQRRWQPNLIIYETGADHKFHFRQVFAVAAMLGEIDKEKLVHIPHGMIRGLEGELSTRQGKTIHLETVLEEAIKRAGQLAKKAGIVKSLSEKQQKEIAREVGVGAIKYNDLKQNPRTDIIFDWEKVLRLKGNSGPYLQYTWARCQSVMRKAKEKDWNLEDILKEKTPNYQPNSTELSVLREICYFSETIKRAAFTYAPNLLAQFLYCLAKQYNYFYDNCRILQDKSQKSLFRLSLTAAAAQTLKNGLCLLGLTTLEKM